MKRAFGCAAGVPAVGVQSLPRQSIRWAGGVLARPSHQTSPSGVVATLVKIELLRDGGQRVRVGFAACPGRDAEKSGLRVDRIKPTVGAEFHPGNVVADGLDLPTRQGRDQHGQIGLAAGAGEGAGDILRVAFGRGQLEDQHMLGQPAFVARHHRGDAQREAFLAQQRIAAIARSERPDFPRFREMDDIDVIRVAGPRYVRAPPASAAAPTECRQGMNAPSSPRTDQRAAPIRVMIRIETAT